MRYPTSNSPPLQLKHQTLKGTKMLDYVTSLQVINTAFRLLARTRHHHRRRRLPSLSLSLPPFSSAKNLMRRAIATIFPGYIYCIPYVFVHTRQAHAAA